MTTVEFITALFYQVDEQMRAIPKHPEARLWPSEVVTLGLLHALKGVGNRAFYRWLTRDYRALFPQLPERTRLFRLFKTHQDWTQVFLAAPTVLGVIDAYGMDELDAIGVDDAEHGPSGQEDLRPVLMGPEEAKKAGAFGEPGKQRPIVSCQPAIERAVAHAFERMEQPQGAHLTGPEVGLGMFGDGAHLFIDLVEQCGDKIHGGHTALLAWEGCHAY